MTRSSLTPLFAPSTLFSQKFSERQLIGFSLVFLLFVALLYLPVLEYPQLHDEETRRAVITEAMINSGDYLVPVFENQIYTSKPPLYNWLIATANLGHTEVNAFAARLPSVLSLMLLIASMAWLLRDKLSRGAIIFLSFGLAFSPEIVAKAEMAEIEATFTLFVSLAIWGWYYLDQKGYRGFKLWLLPCTFAGLAYITKREPGLVFFYFSIAAYLLYQRRFWSLFSVAHICSALIILVLAGLWLAPVINAIGLDTFIDQTFSQVIDRGTGEPGGRLAIHLATYPLIILLAIAPFCLLLLPLLSASVRRTALAQNKPLLIFALITVLVNLPIYLFRADVAVRYFMPMMPTLLVIAAIGLEALLSTEQADSQQRRWQRGLALMLAALSVTLGLITFATYFFPTLFGDFTKIADIIPTPIAVSAVILLAITSLLMAQRAWSHPRIWLLPVTLLIGVQFKLLSLTVILPHQNAHLLKQEAYHELVAAVYAKVPAAELPVHTYGWTPHAFWQQMNFRDVVSESGHLNSKPQGYFVAMDFTVDGFQKKGMQIEVVDQIHLEQGNLVLAYAGARKTAPPEQ